MSLKHAFPGLQALARAPGQAVGTGATMAAQGLKDAFTMRRQMEQDRLKREELEEEKRRAREEERRLSWAARQGLGGSTMTPGSAARSVAGGGKPPTLAYDEYLKQRQTYERLNTDALEKLLKNFGIEIEDGQRVGASKLADMAAREIMNQRFRMGSSRDRYAGWNEYYREVGGRPELPDAEKYRIAGQAGAAHEAANRQGPRTLGGAEASEAELGSGAAAGVRAGYGMGAGAGIGGGVKPTQELYTESAAEARKLIDESGLADSSDRADLEAALGEVIREGGNVRMFLDNAMKAKRALAEQQRAAEAEVESRRVTPQMLAPARKIGEAAGVLPRQPPALKPGAVPSSAVDPRVRGIGGAMGLLKPSPTPPPQVTSRIMSAEEAKRPTRHELGQQQRAQVANKTKDVLNSLVSAVKFPFGGAGEKLASKMEQQEWARQGLPQEPVRSRVLDEYRMPLPPNRPQPPQAPTVDLAGVFTGMGPRTPEELSALDAMVRNPDLRRQALAGEGYLPGSDFMDFGGQRVGPDLRQALNIIKQLNIDPARATSGTRPPTEDARRMFEEEYGIPPGVKTQRELHDTASGIDLGHAHRSAKSHTRGGAVDMRIAGIPPAQLSQMKGQLEAAGYKVLIDNKKGYAHIQRR